MTDLDFTDYDTRLGAYVLLIDEGKILLSNWIERDEVVWSLPGGGVELGESPEEAVHREVLEESGYTAELDELLGVFTRVIPADQRIRPVGERPLQLVSVIYRGRVTGGELTFEVGGSSDEARWFRLDELDDVNLGGNVLPGLRLAGLSL
ncbi:MAG TPA: NUDIX domain-containing protein [Tessaracoccus flavescens]|uniref:NUDIX domain-containing protein n=1 Tax=Tessaracoccus flavescens TaxID=399497 RepID=A0A921EMJ3_9ACTN|nr:NUDIX domain-containing protein [Tessaracoccus flavescens]